MSWDINKFPCPHCLVKALVEGALQLDTDPQEITELVIQGLKEGLGDCEGVEIITNADKLNGNVLH